jgi:hypothetical protein
MKNEKQEKERKLMRLPDLTKPASWRMIFFSMGVCPLGLYNDEKRRDCYDPGYWRTQV